MLGQDGVACVYQKMFICGGLYLKKKLLLEQQRSGMRTHWVPWPFQPVTSAYQQLCARIEVSAYGTPASTQSLWETAILSMTKCAWAWRLIVVVVAVGWWRGGDLADCTAFRLRYWFGEKRELSECKGGGGCGGNLMLQRCDNGPLPQEIPAQVGRKKKRRERIGRGKVSTQNSVAIVPLLRVHRATVTTNNSGCSEKQKQTRWPRQICSQTSLCGNMRFWVGIIIVQLCWFILPCGTIKYIWFLG